jgi:2-polyprenyl-3-methyl-5-hydroxy-6-metoxy-1,4-benzoquinol methylase
MSEQATSTGSRRPEDENIEYGASYYLNYWGGGGPYERNDRWLKFFGDVAEGIIRDFHPSTALDAGCAMGFLVEALRKQGVDASGIDVSEYAISQVDESVAANCRVASLSQPLNRHYDLITCIEVLEHVPPAETDKAIANLCAATDRLLISSTPEDFGEPTHLNVQPPEAWSAALAREGFLRDLEHDLSYLSPWAALYLRRDEPLTETVRRYDRAWWRQRREVNEVRSSLLQTQEQLAELEAGGGMGNRARILKELDASNEEVLRLRDLLVSKDAELGAAKGRLEEIEDRAQRVAGAIKRIESRVPFGKLIGAALRMFQNQQR